MAASAIAGKLGLGDCSVDAVKTALTSQQVTPEQLLELKQADNDFELQMRQARFTHAENMAGIQVQADQIAADDRASARSFAAVEHDHTARNLAVIGVEFLLATNDVKLDDWVTRGSIRSSAS
jgi:hypothetical protein